MYVGYDPEDRGFLIVLGDGTFARIYHDFATDLGLESDDKAQKSRGKK
jgi:hypothetical protein